MAFAASLPVHPRASTAVLLAWFVAVLARAVQERRWPRMGFARAIWVGPVGFYALHVLGLVASSDGAAGWFALEVKLGMVAVPLLGGWEWSRLQEPDRARAGRALVAAFGWGLAARFAWSLLRQTAAAMETGGLEFTYAALSHPFHPSYLALYFTVWWLFVRPAAAASAAAGVAIGLLQSRAGLLVAGCAAVLAAGSRARRVAAAVLVAGMVFGIACAGALGRLRLEAAPAAAGTGSTGGRLQAWTAAWEVLRDSPLGVGTGDVVPELVERYEAAGAEYARVRRMNAHSTYLQTGVALGLPGLAALLYWWGSVAAYAWRRRRVVAVAAIAAIALHGMVEALLELQQGVVFVAFVLTWGAVAVGYERVAEAASEPE